MLYRLHQKFSKKQQFCIFFYFFEDFLQTFETPELEQTSSVLFSFFLLWDQHEQCQHYLFKRRDMSHMNTDFGLCLELLNYNMKTKVKYLHFCKSTFAFTGVSILKTQYLKYSTLYLYVYICTFSIKWTCTISQLAVSLFDTSVDNVTDKINLRQSFVAGLESLSLLYKMSLLYKYKTCHWALLDPLLITFITKRCSFAGLM